MIDPWGTEAAGVRDVIATGPRLVILGSTSFWGADSQELCQAVAAELASIAPLVAVTGGMEGVGRTFGIAFAAARHAAGLPENLFHLLPHGLGPCNTGVTLNAGSGFHQRRKILARLGHVYLVIEGGSGTEHEVTMAKGHGHPVIPLGRTGGHANQCHADGSCPPWAQADDWAMLGDKTVSFAQVAAAVRRLVQAAAIDKQ